MANKRQLKKQIYRICGQAAVEVLVNLPKDRAQPIVINLALLQSHTISNITFAFDRVQHDFANGREYHKARRAYMHKAYKKLRDEFKIGLQGIVKEINDGLTDDERKANKADAAK